MENLGRKAKEFMAWLEQLKQVTSDKTNTPLEEIKINSDAAYEFFNDGYTPTQCLRETWQGDND